MGSRMEALPSSAAPPTPSSTSMSKNTCKNSPPYGNFLRSAPLRSSHPPSRKYSTFPACGGLTMCGKSFLGHYDPATPGHLPADWVTRFLQESASTNRGSQAVKVAAKGTEQQSGAKMASCPLGPIHLLPSMLGAMSISHRMSFPSFCVHSSLKNNPFILEVTPNPTKEPFSGSNKKQKVPSAVDKKSEIEGKAKMTDNLEQQLDVAEAGDLESLPISDLSGGGNKTASLAGKDEGSEGIANDVVGLGPSAGTDDVDINEESAACDLNTSTEDADDELDEPCSSDEQESSTDDDDDDDNDSEYDPVEFDYEFSAGATGTCGRTPCVEFCSVLPCVEVTPPKDCAGEADLLLRGPCLPLRKLLSEESGYCEGASSEEGGKTECGSSWVHLSETLEDDEVDWDDSDDSGSEVDLNEDLLLSLEVLSPQVFCTSPLSTPPINACLAPRASTTSSLLTPTCATRSIRAEDRDVRASACSGPPHRVTKHEPSARNGCSVSKCAVIDTEHADRCDGEHCAKVNHSDRHPVSSSTSPRGNSNRHSKCVRFAEGADLVTVHWICAWRFAYREARKGPWEQFARDRVHFKRRIENVAQVLEPCLAARRAAAD